MRRDRQSCPYTSGGSLYRLLGPKGAGTELPEAKRAHLRLREPEVGAFTLRLPNITFILLRDA